ncbi:PREDICTED: aminoacyl tRNA synthase complex-interacting multifunctional protein 1 [Diuraphis noxia]|uniref:aminoacyl tRNA synthase complex-interacting multifunctional protein 1 n=1 Tax=Diuraphis noxia TaxID=143948 RepID=UPI00076399AD|nr:PREDICTED: aminoacyl tRNA synthase complex-interacting multifunctional protein 1 [Diuraphis noxia]
MNVARKQLNAIKILHAKLLDTLKRLQNDLANNYNQDIERLKLEQESLKAQVETEIAKLKKQKIQIQTGNDINKCITSFVDDVNKEDTLTVKKITNDKCSDNIDVKKNNQTLKTEKKQKKNNPAVPAKNTITTPVDFGKLDLRVAKILSASKHPNADALYVETIDVGEEKPRNVVSGLVKFVPLEAMSNRMVVLLCNLKPSKIRGVLSEAMVMCASSPENVEILEPPPGSVPGDYINVDGYTRSPDKVLKVFEEIAQDLKTDENLQATYKGIPWTVADKGAVVTKSLKNVKIK